MFISRARLPGQLAPTTDHILRYISIYIHGLLDRSLLYTEKYFALITDQLVKRGKLYAISYNYVDFLLPVFFSQSSFKSK